jgi:hypothetical protein
LARARSSSASDKSKSARRPKHCTKPLVFGGTENPMDAGLIKFANFQIAIFRREFQVMIDR